MKNRFYFDHGICIRISKSNAVINCSAIQDQKHRARYKQQIKIITPSRNKELYKIAQCNLSVIMYMVELETIFIINLYLNCDKKQMYGNCNYMGYCDISIFV